MAANKDRLLHKINQLRDYLDHLKEKQHDLMRNGKSFTQVQALDEEIRFFTAKFNDLEAEYHKDDDLNKYRSRIYDMYQTNIPLSPGQIVSKDMLKKVNTISAYASMMLRPTTWTCEICGLERDNQDIQVIIYPIGRNMERNLRYCTINKNNSNSCYNKARARAELETTDKNIPKPDTVLMSNYPPLPF